MRKQILAGAYALLLAAGTTAGAMAFDQGGGRHMGGFGGDAGGFSANVGGIGGMHSLAPIHSSRFAGIRGYSDFRHGRWGARRVVGSYGYGGYR